MFNVKSLSYLHFLNSELIIQNSAFPSFRCLIIKVYADDEERDIGYPNCYHGRHVAIDGKGRGDGLEHDIAETEGYTDTKVEAHASLDLFGGEGYANECEYEGRKRSSYALVILNLEFLDVGYATATLLGDVSL